MSFITQEYGEDADTQVLTTKQANLMVELVFQIPLPHLPPDPPQVLNSQRLNSSLSCPISLPAPKSSINLWGNQKRGPQNILPVAAES